MPVACGPASGSTYDFFWLGTDDVLVFDTNPTCPDTSASPGPGPAVVRQRPNDPVRWWRHWRVPLTGA